MFLNKFATRCKKAKDNAVDHLNWETSFAGWAASLPPVAYYSPAYITAMVYDFLLNHTKQTSIFCPSFWLAGLASLPLAPFMVLSLVSHPQATFNAAAERIFELPGYDVVPLGQTQSLL